jgi:acyl transferase domain-containing protein/3-hydroxymyristoyl/3-hydroxydecanoyl-(acyl carrier protein) dehydratase
MTTENIAIVAFAGRFPGAGADLDRFWANVATAQDCSRDVPPGRWILPPPACTDQRIAHPDSVYTTRGYYLDDFEPDLTGLDLDPHLIRQLDPLFQLVLDVGQRAWHAARMDAVKRDRVGVVLGNICLPTDRANDLCREILGGQLGLPSPGPVHPLNRYVAGLPAGLLARGLGLGGGSFTLDAACASSLYAIKLACDELRAGRADAMLAGGSSRPDCQYTQMGFAQLRALAPSGRCSPFDAQADGLVVGEGAGVFVLKRLSDALAHGDTIHAVITGIGLSNDQHGNLLAPAKEGQLRAMRAAYRQAGWQPSDVQLIECHATGTPVGDAVEFDSLCELWGRHGWHPGQCVIGSVKSTVGHLLTGAGAAALAKVLLALKSQQLPPQANFTQPAPGLRYQDGPFRILRTAEPWLRPDAGTPRRAAISGFGFGGVNAHLLVEEWTATTPKTTVAIHQPPLPPEPVAVVGLAARVGPWNDARALQEYLFNGQPAPPLTKTNGWSLAREQPPPGYYIHELAVPIDRFRIPPKELEETLPQQLLMLQVAAAALEDCTQALSEQETPSADESSPDAHDSQRVARASRDDTATTTGVFIGLGLDFNTTNFHLRWSVLAAGGNPDEASPPLTANRTMGALGSIAASRIARTFHFGGPSHTVCSEEGSAGRAIELGVRALQARELDRVVVGSVDLAGDPRMVLPGRITQPGEGAFAFVLKRLSDAERDGDRVYAVIRGVGVAAHPAAAWERAQSETCAAHEAHATNTWGQTAIAFNAEADVGHCGFASGAASFFKACIALYQQILPASPPRYWLHNRVDGPRRAYVAAHGADGSHFAFLLEEHPRLAQAAERRQPLGARNEAVFVVAGNTPTELLAGIARLHELASQHATRNIEWLARAWFRTSRAPAAAARAVAFVARSASELTEQLAFAQPALQADANVPFPATAKPALRDRVFYNPQPLGPVGRLAFVFPGSGNQFDGMARELSTQWPEVFRRQHAENQRLRDQFAPHFFWENRTAAATARDLMFGQVTTGAAVSDILLSLGIRCDAMIGLSLGESAGLLSLRIWRDRDEMYRRMERSTLFVSDLAPPYNAARAFWNTPPEEAADWASAIVAASPADVLAALRPGGPVYLLIVNTPHECVVGGPRPAVEKLAAALESPLHWLDGVTLAHCEVGRPVEPAYRELHTLPVSPQPITVYSGAWGRRYTPSEHTCADSITAGLVGPIDVPRVIEAAYRDGVRGFIEVGPGNSCSRMISTILEGQPHWVRAAHAARSDAVSQILRLVGHLAAERWPVDLAALYDQPTRCVGHREPTVSRGNEVVVPVGLPPVVPRTSVSSSVMSSPSSSPLSVAQPSVVNTLSHTVSPASYSANRSRITADNVPSPLLISSFTSFVEAAASAQVRAMQAQESFLRLNQRLLDSAASVVRFQTALLQTWVQSAPSHAGLAFPEAKSQPPHVADASRRPPTSLTYEQCCTFAAGRIADVLGPMFAEVDSFPTRVRLPDGPLQLVDRITLIEGEPKSLTSGRVVTEHTVRADRWYLENGRIPTALSVESGQADLFLSGYLGIDFQTRGLAVYRLLDAVVSFHRELPRVGETIVYDIHIDRFVQQGDAWLFHFWFDGTVNGQPFITMRNGVAGFFTADALAAGKGIVQTALDKQRLPGKKPADWQDFVPLATCSLSAAQVDALRAGDLVAAYGPDFARLKLHRPATLPGGMLRLVDRVPLIDPQGGRFGIGFIRAEFDIHPDDWFLTCHFVDDQVMPGTLMYECCLHTLRILLMRLGWVGEAGEVVCEPVPGINSRLKCRGQVIATTRTVTYEVTVKELGYRPEPYCIADALMYADGKPIVEITNMTLRMSGLTREKLAAAWSHSPAPRARKFLYDSAKILAFSNGKPSEAFGERYRVFDSERVIARLPGPPFQFLDGITHVHGEPFVMKAGARCEAKYTVPHKAWYFDANRSDRMPFAVLLEIALQPCGWLAAYCGSALTSTDDLSFRNLGGQATQHRAVTPDSGELTTTVTLTRVSTSAGMIIQHFDMRVQDGVGDVYTGNTYFGFFTKAALANQIGIRDAKVPWPSAQEMAHAEVGQLPHQPPFPAPSLRMIDRIDAYLPTGGSRGLGLVVGSIAVDPEFWFFQAHFYQDPVWPGSLGLESFLQLLKFAAWKRWGEPARGWQTVALGRPHTWVYRGQVLPTDRQVQVVLEVVAADDEHQRLVANGFLSVDGRVIYQMTDFSLE